jgi:hypothetical protein
MAERLHQRPGDHIVRIYENGGYAVNSHVADCTKAEDAPVLSFIFFPVSFVAPVKRPVCSISNSMHAVKGNSVSMSTEIAASRRLSLEQHRTGDHRVSEQGNVRHIGSTRTGSGTIVIHCTLLYLYNNRWVNVSLRRALRSCHELQE